MGTGTSTVYSHSCLQRNIQQALFFLGSCWKRSVFEGPNILPEPSQLKSESIFKECVWNGGSRSRGAQVKLIRSMSKVGTNRINKYSINIRTWDRQRKNGAPDRIFYYSSPCITSELNSVIGHFKLAYNTKGGIHRILNLFVDRSIVTLHLKCFK